MRRSYESELAALPETYRVLRHADVEHLSRVLRGVVGRPTFFVASGGALAAARLCADSLVRSYGTPAQILTPLEFSSIPATSRDPVVVLSAGGRNSDTLMALRHAQEGNFEPVVFVTHRPDLPPRFLKSARQIAHITLPIPAGRDGFLATNSLIALTVAWLRAIGLSDQLPAQLPINDIEPTHLRERCLVLTAPGLSAASIDLETRLSELGLAAVQLADYRNFAHGRHFGFHRNLENTTVVALVAEPYRALAESTLELLPESSHIVKLESKSCWPTSTIEIMCSSMQVAAYAARERDLRIERPGVPKFGRSLYNLSYRKKLPAPAQGPVSLKLAAGGLGLHSVRRTEEYAARLERWIDDVNGTTFGSIVLDYDGTVCSTADRREDPEAAVQESVLRLLDAGLTVGFASGRGRSLWTALRRWIPAELWDRIPLALYNGGVRLSLSDDAPETAPAKGRERVLELVSDSRASEFLVAKASSMQIRLELAEGSPIDVRSLAAYVRSLLDSEPGLGWKSAASGHSIDVVPQTSSKYTIAAELEQSSGLGVLCIGDQGDPLGNDFALLNSTPYSLTVDRCSGDPTRCWNLGRAGQAGPQLLVRYLSAIRSKGGAGNFMWKLR